MKTPEIESRASGKCVIWEGENGVYLRVIIDVAGGRPSVRELAFDQGKGWTQLAGDLVPEFEITTGIRRPEERQDQPFEERWWNYSDTPLAHKEDIRRAQATFD